LHPPLSTVDEVTSALLGPLGGVAAVIVVSLMCTSRDTFVAASVAAVAVFHVASWLPEYGDGKTVRKIWRQYHEK
jgi:tetrahydromethanopterin S-methyltransferase subunit D